MPERLRGETRSRFEGHNGRRLTESDSPDSGAADDYIPH